MKSSALDLQIIIAGIKNGQAKFKRPAPCSRRRRSRGCLTLAHHRDGFFEHIHGDISFLFGHDEWRRDADGARAAAEKENAVLKRGLDDAVALSRGIFFGLLCL